MCRPLENSSFETNTNHHANTIHSMSNRSDCHLYSRWWFHTTFAKICSCLYLSVCPSAFFPCLRLVSTNVQYSTVLCTQFCIFRVIYEQLFVWFSQKWDNDVKDSQIEAFYSFHLCHLMIRTVYKKGSHLLARIDVDFMFIKCETVAFLSLFILIRDPLESVVKPLLHSLLQV